MTGGSILGTKVRRVEDPKLLTSGGDYIADLRLDDALHLTYVRATVPHARILSIDTSDAAAAPGVVAVYTFADLGIPAAPPMLPMCNQAMTRPLLADGVVRFVGEAVALVVAESRQAGADAAELVAVDYDPLPVVVDMEDSLRDEVLLFPDAGTNVIAAVPRNAEGDVFADCEVVVDVRMINQRMAVAPIEPRVAAAVWDGTRLTAWAAGQGAHNSRNGIARTLGLTPDEVHCITPDVGGSFGGKSGTTPEELLVGWVARKHGRPARWMETRTENMTAAPQGRGQVQYARLGGTRDGRLLAYELRVVQDCGAYAFLGPLMPTFTRLMASGTYAIPTVVYESKSVATNTTPVGAFRGAGRPEATSAIERAIDVFAAEIGMDPADVRRRNVLAPDAFPLTTPTGAKYDVGEYGDALERLLVAADYAGLRREQAERRARGDHRLLGIGLSSYVEVTNPMGAPEYGGVEVTPEGRAIVRCGNSAHGQGLGTSLIMIASERTGIPIDRFDYVQSDTDKVPRGGGTGGSRSLQTGGSAVTRAADVLIDKARELAAEHLEANPDDIVLDTSTGGFHVAGTPAKRIGWFELAAANDESIAGEYDFKPDGATFPFGAHLVVVEVDADTGRVQVERLVAVDDAGTMINPLIVDGQVHGGLAAGIAQALLEEIRYDDDGNPLTTNFADYAVISPTEVPSFELHPMETPTPMNPLGAKGIGESGTVGSTPAVQNAVVDALAHLGVRHVDMPLTAERVWRHLQGATR
jgi:carbon-monoxide dehydrogenase large subunit